MAEEEDNFALPVEKEAKQAAAAPQMSVIDLPDAPRGYGVKVLSQLNASYSTVFRAWHPDPAEFTSLATAVWFVDSSGQLTEYARIRGNSTISGLRFDRKGVLYVATIQGTVYRIDPNKSGRILAQLDGSLTGAEPSFPIWRSVQETKSTYLISRPIQAESSKSIAQVSTKCSSADPDMAPKGCFWTPTDSFGVWSTRPVLL